MVPRTDKTRTDTDRHKRHVISFPFSGWEHRRRQAVLETLTRSAVILLVPNLRLGMPTSPSCAWRVAQIQLPPVLSATIMARPRTQFAPEALRIVAQACPPQRQRRWVSLGIHTETMCAVGAPDIHPHGCYGHTPRKTFISRSQPPLLSLPTFQLIK